VNFFFGMHVEISSFLVSPTRSVSFSLKTITFIDNAKMTSNEITARLRFLEDSAKLMSATSSATSAYLMSQVNQLMFDHEIEPSESHRRYACGACGSLMIAGWTSTLKKETTSRRPITKAKAGHSRPKKDENHRKTRASVLVYKCNLCTNDTKHRIPNYDTPAFRRGHKKLAQSASSQTSSIKVSKSNSANTNSKKRSRARKGGLQALLAAKKDNGASPGFGLDLMDLMKKA